MLCMCQHITDCVTMFKEYYSLQVSVTLTAFDLLFYTVTYFYFFIKTDERKNVHQQI